MIFNHFQLGTPMWEPSDFEFLTGSHRLEQSRIRGYAITTIGAPADELVSGERPFSETCASQINYEKSTSRYKSRVDERVAIWHSLTIAATGNSPIRIRYRADESVPPSAIIQSFHLIHISNACEISKRALSIMRSSRKP
jgi:hypothetical protein